VIATQPQGKTAMKNNDTPNSKPNLTPIVEKLRERRVAWPIEALYVLHEQLITHRQMNC
jgi:hypothetical protein